MSTHNDHGEEGAGWSERDERGWTRGGRQEGHCREGKAKGARMRKPIATWQRTDDRVTFFQERTRRSVVATRGAPSRRHREVSASTTRRRQTPIARASVSANVKYALRQKTARQAPERQYRTVPKIPTSPRTLGPPRSGTCLAATCCLGQAPLARRRAAALLLG